MDYNTAQQLAIQTTEGPVLVIAGPGTGKTGMMVGRVRHLIESGLARPDQILLTTFTRKAADELVFRLSQGPHPAMAALAGQLHIGNFHQLALEILSDFIEASDYLPGFRLVSETEIRRLLDRYWPGLCGYERDGRIAYPQMAHAMDLLFPRHRPQDPSGLSYRQRDFLRLMGRVREGFSDLSIDCPETRAAAYLLDRYRRMLRHHNVLDFTEVLYETNRLLDQAPVLAAAQARARYIMVDEYQDTNPIQEAIIEKLSRATGNLCVVGDDDQSLYRFRGATVENLLAFERRYPGTQTIYLTENYRSGRRILETCAAYIDAPYGDQRDPLLEANRFQKHMTAQKERGEGAVYRFLSDDLDQWAIRLADFLAQAHAQGWAYRNMAFLSYSVRPEVNPAVSALTRALRARAIPFQSSNSATLASLSVVRRLLSCLLLTLAGPAAPLLQEPVARRLLASLPQKGADARARQIAHWQSFWAQGGRCALLDLAYSFFFCPPFEALWQAALAGEAAAVADGQALAELLSFLMERSETDGHPALGEENRAAAATWLLSAWSDLLSSRQDRGSGEEAPVEEALQILTIHQAKGLEFPLVLLEEGRARSLWTPPRQGSDLLPRNRLLGHALAPQLEADLDRIRQYYTAMTRARDLLLLTACTDPRAVRKPADLALEASFLRLNQALADLPEDACPCPSPPPSAAPQSRPAAARLPVYAYTTDLALYQTCPRAFFFFRRLGLPQKPTPAMAFGTLLHEGLCFLHRQAQAPSDAKATSLADLLQNLARGLALKGQGLSAQKRALAENRLTAYQAREQNRLLAQTQKAEAALSLFRPHYRLQGALDLVLTDGGLIDFKASLPDNPVLLQRYRGQLLVYRILLDAHQQALADTGPSLSCPPNAPSEPPQAPAQPKEVLPFRNALYDLSADTAPLRDFHFSPDDLAQGLAEIDAIAAAIGAGHFQAPAQNPESCQNCPMKAYCKPAATKAAAEKA